MLWHSRKKIVSVPGTQGGIHRMVHRKEEDVEFIYNILIDYGLNLVITKLLFYIILFVLVFLICFIITIIANKIIRKSFRHRWIKIMDQNGVFKRLLRIIPGIILYNMAAMFYELAYIVLRLTELYLLITILILGKAIIRTIEDIYNEYPISKDRPIKGLLQVIEIIFYIIMVILLISALLDKSPIAFLSGIGALTAVVSLIFKDPILNFVAGIQLSWNDMLRIGDWIEVPKHSADGSVIEVSLNTVKVQNFDKSITTIPTYDLVSDSFRNWRGMFESGGRRLKRSLNIDITSVGFLSKEKIEELKKINYIRDYLIEEENKINEYNDQVENPELLINGKHLTNLSVFRAYIENYLSHNALIHKEMISMVRQLALTEAGIPIEIYVFTNDTQWTNFETVQAEVFDHLISVVDTFDLRIYQRPSSYDVQNVSLK